MFLSCMHSGLVFFCGFDNFVCVPRCWQFLRALAAIMQKMRVCCWLKLIEELKKKRSQALTEEQKTDIPIAYRSLQVEDLKRKKMRPGRKCGKGNYQRRVSSVLGYSSKTVGLAYRDWNRKQEIKVAVARKPKCQRIPKSKQVLLSVRALVRQQRGNSERVVA